MHQKKWPLPKRIWLSALVLLFFNYIPTTDSQAQNQARIRLRCPEVALNIPLYQKAIAQRVRQTVDKTLYQAIRVRVGLRRIGSETGIQTSSFEEITNGLSLTNNALAFLANGELSYNLVCSHIYIARIRVSALEKESGARFTSLTDSRIRIVSAGEAMLRR